MDGIPTRRHRRTNRHTGNTRWTARWEIGRQRLWLPLLLAGTLLGCATPARVEQLEAQLRDQQDQLTDQANSLESLESERDALRHQRDLLLAQSDSLVQPEAAELLVRIDHLAINSWLTGGRNTDGQPGDDELVVMIQPRDRDNEPVKLPGTLQLQLTDPAAPKGSRQIGAWTFTPKQCRTHWLGSMLSRGFLFKLPWQSPPTRNRLLIHSRFDTTDGRRFDADLLIHIQPPGPSDHKPLVLPPTHTSNASPDAR